MFARPGRRGLDGMARRLPPPNFVSFQTESAHTSCNAPNLPTMTTWRQVYIVGQTTYFREEKEIQLRVFFPFLVFELVSDEGRTESVLPSFLPH